MAVIVKEFDPVSVKNSHVQFKNSEGNFDTGIDFGFIGTISGETVLIEVIKRKEGFEAGKKVKPQKMTLNLTGRVYASVLRDIFGIKSDGLKPGVYSYGTDSIGKEFIFTADEIDDFEEVTKLTAYMNCRTASGLTVSIENGASEVAEISLTLECYPDEHGQIKYEAFTSELDDTTVSQQWHSAFTRELVEVVPTP